MNNLVDFLKTLENLDLVSPKNQATVSEFTFNHVFTQESVYSSLLRSDRRQLHLQVGETLEVLHQDQSLDAERALALAHHFQEAEDKQRALKYLKIAAMFAKQTYANREAKTLYRRILSLLPRQQLRRSLGCFARAGTNFG